MIARCVCGKLAVWNYMPSTGDEDYTSARDGYCDDCVPRGCSCNRIQYTGDDPTEHTDDRGRLLPCCEFDYDEFGVDNQADWSEFPVWERLAQEQYPECA